MHKRIAGNKPWMLLGDFNVTLMPVEHSGGSSVMTSDMQDFHELVNDIEVEDICTFMDKFGNAHGVFLPYMASDHSPAMLCISDKIPKTKKSFKFSNFIADKKEFKEIVKKEWEEDIYGCHMTSSLHDNLIQAQKNLSDNPYHAAYRSEATKCYEEYTSAAEDEMELLQQQSKIKWLSEGNKNTAYFHSTLKARRHKNGIETTCDENGVNFERDMVAKQFVKHFKNFLGEAKSVQQLEYVGDIIKTKLDMEEANNMVADVTNKEIKNAMFDIDNNKALGPDGFSAYFFKKAWDIIGKDVCDAFKEFFCNGKLLGEVNATIIALVPKCPTPIKVYEFRPIACCNVIYKCISKIITNRIKEGLTKIVSCNQRAFVPGRHIQDMILITQELLKGYNKRNRAKICAMKIDIQKAYDTVRIKKSIGHFHYIVR
ncbi:RNA-directed DNA polymerase, eukaryota, reverse transcriptase zinc-binding domain protein [Tanacetum coccineum]